MGRITNYIRNVRSQLHNRAKSTYRSRAVRVLLGVALAGAILVPPMVPLALMIAAAVVALPVAASVIGPALPSRLGSLVPSFLKGGKTVRASQPVQVSQQQMQPSRKHDERHGRSTGDPLTDALVKKLRDNGLRVSTDWKEAKGVLKSLPEKYDVLKKKDARVYGFVYGGVTYINPKAAKADVPVHEYTHIWAEVLRQKNPDEWKSIVGLMKKETDLWNKVVASYPHLETDDEIADEVLATYSGLHGQQRLQQECVPGRKPEDVFSALLQALEKFWKNVALFFDKGVHYESKEDIADRVLSDFLTGVNPLEYGEIKNMNIKHNMQMKENDKTVTGRAPAYSEELQATIDRVKGFVPDMRMDLFARMVSDCKYSVTTGGFNQMWMPDIKGQVAVMRAIHGTFPEGTFRTSLEDIDLLEKQMLAAECFTDMSVAVPNPGDKISLNNPVEILFYGDSGRVEKAKFSAVENKNGYVTLTGDRDLDFDRAIPHDQRILTDVVRKIYVDSQVSSGIVRESMERQIEKFESATGYALAVKNGHPYYGEDLMISGVHLDSLPENLEVNGDLTLENTVIEGGLPKGLVVYGNLNVKGGNRLSLPDDAFVEGSFRMSEGAPKAYSIVDLSKYDMLPKWVLATSYAVCKLTKGGADADRPVAVMKIDGQPVAREISQKDFDAYFRTKPDGRGTELAADDIINKYFPSERKAQLTRDMEVLRGACPKEGDYFELPEVIEVESVARTDLYLDENASAVYSHEGEIMVGYESNAVRFRDLSIEDQRRVVSVVDNALYSPDIAIDERPNNSVEGATRYVTMYQGDKAKALCDEILNGGKNERYPLHFGAKGFFQDSGKYVAFDNSSKDCWVEEFYTRESAVGWCSGAMETEEAQNRQEETDAMREYFLKEAVKATAARIGDPSAKAFTPEQRGTVQQYINLFKGEDQKLWAAGHVFYTAGQEPGMGKIPSAWKADVREELKDLAQGKVRESENVGLKR